MSTVIIPFGRRDNRTDEQKYMAAVEKQTGIKQVDPRRETHWRVTVEREYWPSTENPNYYETEKEADNVALRIDQTIGGMVDVIPPGWYDYDK